MVGHAEATQGCHSCPLFTVRRCPVAAPGRELEADCTPRLMDVPGGKVIVAESEPSTLVGVVVSGLLRMTVTASDGRHQVIGLHGPGRLFGDLYQALSLYGIEAALPSRTCTFDRHTFERLIARSPALTMQTLFNLLKDLEETRAMAVLLGTTRMSERIARYLLTHCDITRVHGHLEVVQPIGRRDLAALLGTTMETISRFVQDITRRGIVRPGKVGHLVIIDLARLCAIAGLDETLLTVPTAGARERLASQPAGAHRIPSAEMPAPPATRLNAHDFNKVTSVDHHQ